MKHFLITGVSSGIGYAGAEALIGAGHHVFGSVRTADDSARVMDALGENFTPLMFDVTDGAAIEAAAAQVEDTIGDNGLAGLVNNAGVGVGGPLMHLTVDEIRYQFEVNVFGALAVTQAFLPMLGARKPCPHPPGRIVNISSVAGKIAAPFVGPYSASKHALEGLSHALRRELLLYGVDVVIIGPGSVATPIWDKVDELDVGRFAGTDYERSLTRFTKGFSAQGRREGLPAKDLGVLIRQVLEDPKPKARYAIVPNVARNWAIPRVLPPRVLDRIIQRQLFRT